MSKLKIWLIPILIVLIALAGLVYFRGRLPEEAEPATVTTMVEVEAPKGPKGFAKPPEPSPQEKAEKDTDAIVAALNAGDVSACEEITWDKELKNRCEDDLNYPAALKSSNANICEKIHNEELRIQCFNKVYMSIAVDQNNTEYCDKITDESLKQMCFDQVMMFVAHSATSIGDCAGITSASLKKQCEDNYYYKNSTRDLDEAGCNSISDSIMAERCKTTVAKNIEVNEQGKKAYENASAVKSSQEVLGLCNNLSGDKVTTCKDAVYPQLAYDNKDLSYCEKISDKTKVSDCIEEQSTKINSYYLRQALAMHDKSLCSEILDEDLKKVCQNS